eukprot:g6191.t1
MTNEPDTTTSAPNVFFSKSSAGPLPSCWLPDPRPSNLNIVRRVQISGLEVKYTGPGSADTDAASVRTDHPVPLDCPFHYFEVTIVNEGMKGLIGVGYSGFDVKLDRLPGWDPHSFGYHGDDGNIFGGSGNGNLFGPTFTKDDVIGCYWNRAEKLIGYTKNGIHLGIAFVDVAETTLYPTVGFRTRNEEIRANFGLMQFVADLDGMIMEQRQRVLKHLDETEITHPTKPVSSIIAEIILDYLIHHRYPKTAAMVSYDLFDGNRLSEKEEAGIITRQRIYEAVLCGNIDEALSQTDAIAPGTLEAHPRILFKLRCQKFIQMIQSVDEDTHAALQFGRTFLTPSCSSSEDQAFLSEVLTLIAYDDPDTSPCGYLLGIDYRRDLAEELNNAIVESQRKRPKPPLEAIYKQMVRQNFTLFQKSDLVCIGGSFDG